MVVLAALDSTLFFSLPFGIDAAVIILAARLGDHWWLVPLLATAGSVGRRGAHLLDGRQYRRTGARTLGAAPRLQQVRARVRKSGAIALAVLDLIPPPFPFTPFVLAAGALEVKPQTFFMTLVICRLFRFGLEAALAVVYGRNILAWLDSDLFHDTVLAFILLAVLLTTLSLITDRALDRAIPALSQRCLMYLFAIRRGATAAGPSVIA